MLGRCEQNRLTTYLVRLSIICSKIWSLVIPCAYFAAMGSAVSSIVPFVEQSPWRCCSGLPLAKTSRHEPTKWRRAGICSRIKCRHGSGGLLPRSALRMLCVPPTWHRSPRRPGDTEGRERAPKEPPGSRTQAEARATPTPPPWQSQTNSHQREPLGPCSNVTATERAKVQLNWI